MTEEFNENNSPEKPKRIPSGARPAGVKPVHKKPVKKPIENTSGKGKSTKVPDTVAKKFNWGACLLSWIWGIGNKTYITFLIFISFIIPLGPLAMMIWFGIKGNTWAWQNKHFKDIKSFHEYQKKWAIAAIIVFIIGLILNILCFGAIMSILSSMAGNAMMTQTGGFDYSGYNY